MKAMILAAGRGERLRPLTDSCPKPLLKAGSFRLIEYHLQQLATCGISDVVINLSWLGHMIKDALGNGKKYQMNIQYSDEGDQALETAGGIIHALPLLGDEPFLVVNGDIWTDFELCSLTRHRLTTEAHLVLVENPDHHRDGDFALDGHFLENVGDKMYTYSGIGIYTHEFFQGCATGKSALAPLIRQKIQSHKVSGELHTGLWTDAGTVERLQILNNSL